MCGIAGIRRSKSYSTAVVQQLVGGLRHRGPDDEGFWQDADWHIGMRRLAIIDVAHGRQPMISANGQWALVVNGEIYNFRALRQEMVARGTRFRTDSDTEVLLELVSERGVPRALEAIEGMFALCAVDVLAGELWLARDRFGEKPLYLDRRDGGFAFCSELTPLLRHVPAPARASGKGVAAILRYGYPWPGVTAVEGISELLPGQWLKRARNGEETLGSYWTLPDRVDEEPGSIKSCGQKVLDLLDRSVKDRLVADVPLGLFLSGGIDSGAVAAAAVRYRPDIEAVTVGFAQQSYDERPLARATSAHLGIRLREETGDALPFSPQNFDDFIGHYGQPFHDTSAVPTRAVSRAARKHFTVVLSGDGGDELFSGYLAEARYAKLRRWGGGRLGSRLSGWAGSALPDFGRWESLKRALDLNGSLTEDLLLHRMDGVFTDEALAALADGTPWQSDVAHHLCHAREAATRLWHQVKDPCLVFAVHQIRHELPQDILAKVDRMSMAESLEVRAPFLDSGLARYALSLPAHMKLQGSLGKLILRESLAGKLPASVLAAPKRGFNLPVRAWLGPGFWAELEREVEDYANDSAAELNPAAVKRQVLKDRDRCARANSYRALHRAFLVYGFLRWRRLLSDRPALRPTPTLEASYS